MHCKFPWEEAAQSPVVGKGAGEFMHRAVGNPLGAVRELVFTPCEG